MWYIVHQQDHYGPYAFIQVKKGNLLSGGAATARYALGLTAPHYPVPAIRTEVGIYPTHVAISVLDYTLPDDDDLPEDYLGDVYHYGY